MGFCVSDDEFRRWVESGIVADDTQPAGPALDCSEDEFQTHVIRLAKRNGWESYHPYDSRKSREGWPDWCFWRTRFFMAELKKEDGIVSEKQRETINGLRRAGVCVYIWRPSSWEQIVEVLK